MTRVKSIFNIIAIIVLALGAVVLVVWLASREGGYNEPKGTYHSPTLFAMDTTLDITIQGRSTSQAKADVEAAAEVIRRIEDETSRFKPESDVSRINRMAGVAPVKVSDDTLAMVEKSIDYSRQTDGAFDITVAPLVKIWGFYEQKYRIPTAEEIATAKSLVDWRQIRLDGANKTVMLGTKGMEIDLGSVAKGYAVGQVYELFKQGGIEHALVNFGGSIGALGQRSDGKDWVVGVKDPRGEGGAIVGSIQVHDAFVDSSGDYERFFIRDGKRYFHIFDPATGRNPVTGVVSATVVGNDDTDADIINTILMLYTSEAGLEFMRTRPGFDAVTIDGKGNSYTTPDMKSKYKLQMEE